MNIINVVQGSAEWLTIRAKHFCASDAPAMMGVSPYMTRNDLLRAKHLGIIPDVDAVTQARFAAGHAAEAAARQIAERIIGEELYSVTCSTELDDLPLLASLDGLTLDGETSWEHKLWNEALAAQIRNNEVPQHHAIQMEQQMLVSGASRTLFMCSDGTEERCVWMWYTPKGMEAERILAGWRQFDDDLKNYQHVEVLPAAIAAPMMQLPALSIQVTGSIALVDNLKVFGERLEAFIDAIDKNPSDDQAFADAEAAIKTLGTAETALESAKASALAQTASIDEMTRTVALYAGQARQTRLMLEKLVKTRKETIRGEIIQGGREALAAHIATLSRRLGKVQMPAIAADFASVIKGKKTIASLRDAVDTELARAKIEANAVADRIQINLDSLRDLAKDHDFLFHDFAHLVLKANDDLVALIKVRIAEHQINEAKRIEAERERIRAEEAAKLKREQEERDHADRIAREQATVQLPIVPITTELTKTEEDTAASAAKITRPTGDQIVRAVANAFGADHRTAFGWIIEAFGKEGGS